MIQYQTARARAHRHKHTQSPTLRQDVWGMLWASDNPDLVALMEKGRMYVLRGGTPEEPVTSSGTLAAFNDLEVRWGLGGAWLCSACALCVCMHGSLACSLCAV